MSFLLYLILQCGTDNFCKKRKKFKKTIDKEKISDIIVRVLRRNP